jgi:iron complex transport system ATP-binding protein
VSERLGDAPAVVVRDVTFAYGTRRVLTDLALEIPARALVALLGRNGSGKSTLLRLMAGLLAAETGAIEVFGEPLVRLAPQQRARRIGFLPQHHRPVFPFAVEDVVLTGRAGHAGLAPGAEDAAAVDEALERVGIGAYRSRPYTELSGGERQLVLVARVLAQRPRLLLLDEPFAHLDPAHQAGLVTLLKRLVTEGLTVVAALHDPNVACLHADESVLLAGGRFAGRAERGAGFDAATLEGAYGVAPWLIEVEGRRLLLPGPRPGSG